MAMTTLSGHRDIIMGAYFSLDAQTAYTVARDGAVFTWNFQAGERVEVVDKSKRKRQKEGDSDDSEEEEGSEEEEEEKKGPVKTKRGGKWVLGSREFLWEPHTRYVHRQLLAGGANGLCLLFLSPYT